MIQPNLNLFLILAAYLDKDCLHYRPDSEDVVTSRNGNGGDGRKFIHVLHVTHNWLRFSFPIPSVRHLWRFDGLIGRLLTGKYADTTCTAMIMPDSLR